MRLGWLGIALFLLAFAAFSARVKQEILARSGPSQDSLVGLAAPDFSLPTLSGDEVNLREVTAENEVVVVNFWATWCAPCRVEMPQFERIRSKYKDQGLEILALNVDEDLDVIEAFVEDKSFSFAILLDERGEIAKRYRVNAFPTSVLVGKDGEVMEVIEGVNPYLEYQIESILEKKREP